MKSSILLFSSLLNRGEELSQALTASGYSVVDVTIEQIHQPTLLPSYDDSVLMICLNSITSFDSQYVRQVQDTHPMPIIVFASESNQSEIADLILAGTTSLVVDSCDPARLESIIETAKVRFGKCQGLKSKLSEVEERLAERRDIDRAKGVIMSSKDMTEDQAYKLLRSMAMQKNIRIGILAKSVVAAAEIMKD